MRRKWCSEVSATLAIAAASTGSVVRTSTSSSALFNLSSTVTPPSLTTEVTEGTPERTRQFATVFDQAARPVPDSPPGRGGARVRRSRSAVPAISADACELYGVE
ncbi:hypothetical protein GCM10007147_15200 [Nocardiopsis kunsanensis]|uniref:Uncharacterized protein n=1 Tax=Nocardiopsis kunsanensis TaxID=141693 RepID=A0A918XAF3_9ACTN|nr:hypothetical protein GCM10007147_15200 [Nocardiopsis kunsanensis]